MIFINRLQVFLDVVCFENVGTGISPIRCRIPWNFRMYLGFLKALVGPNPNFAPHSLPPRYKFSTHGRTLKNGLASLLKFITGALSNNFLVMARSKLTLFLDCLSPFAYFAFYTTQVGSNLTLEINTPSASVENFFYYLHFSCKLHCETTENSYQISHTEKRLLRDSISQIISQSTRLPVCFKSKTTCQYNNSLSRSDTRTRDRIL